MEQARYFSYQAASRELSCQCQAQFVLVDVAILCLSFAGYFFANLSRLPFCLSYFPSVLFLIPYPELLNSYLLSNIFAISYHVVPNIFLFFKTNTSLVFFIISLITRSWFLCIHTNPLALLCLIPAQFPQIVIQHAINLNLLLL